MPLLQVKDCPENTYEQLRECAKQEHRSISQQTIYIVERYLSNRSSSAAEALPLPVATAVAPAAAPANRYSRYSRDFSDETDYRAKRLKTMERIRQHPPIPVSEDAPDTVELLRQIREEEAR